MINRRELMASGIAATLVSRNSWAGLSAAAAPVAPFRTVFISDQRIPAARVAARSADSSGAWLQPFASDITSVYQWLDLQLRVGPMRVAGLAKPQALFAIERLAWDRGLRTIYRGIHPQSRRRPASHEFAGSPAIINRIRADDVGDWPAGLGAMLADTIPAAADYRHPVTAQLLPEEDDLLVSWLIA